MSTTRGDQCSVKKFYKKPQLLTYGDLRNLTQSGAGSKTEIVARQVGTLKICGSDGSKSKC